MMTTKNILYSVVVPIYNDGSLAGEFCVEFEKVFKQFTKEDDISKCTELIFVNDGSKNDSIEQLVELSKKNKFVKVIDLSRNFGQHIALSCGYKHAKGAYVCMLNVDMQEPPSEIPKLIKFICEKKYDIVFGISSKRQTNLINRITSKAFILMLNKLTKSNTPLNICTIRVMNRKFINAYNSLNEKSRYIPGLESWLGFKHGYLEIFHQQRKIGESSYNTKKRFQMALNTILSFSDYPLRIIVMFGLVISFLGLFFIIFLVVAKIFFIDFLPGYTTLIALITFLGGVQLIAIGFASLYIGKILKEVQGRPLYIVNQAYNLED